MKAAHIVQYDTRRWRRRRTAAHISMYGSNMTLANGPEK